MELLAGGAGHVPAVQDESGPDEGGDRRGGLGGVAGGPVVVGGGVAAGQLIGQAQVPGPVFQAWPRRY